MWVLGIQQWRTEPSNSTPRYYTIEQRGDYLLLRYPKLGNPAVFEHSAKELLELAETNHITKLLLFIEVPFSEVSSEDWIVGLNLANALKRFDKVAVYATDPAQFEYIEHTNGVLQNMGVIKDIENFKNFADLNWANASW